MDFCEGHADVGGIQASFSEGEEDACAETFIRGAETCEGDVDELHPLPLLVFIAHRVCAEGEKAADGARGQELGQETQLGCRDWLETRGVFGPCWKQCCNEKRDDLEQVEVGGGRRICPRGASNGTVAGAGEEGEEGSNHSVFQQGEGVLETRGGK